MTLAPDPFALAAQKFEDPPPGPGDASPGALAAWLTDGREMQARHLDLIDQAFIDIANGETDRVAIFMPPRRGKSRRAARWGALWYLRKFPHRRVAIASYGAELAEEHSRWVRDQIVAYNGADGVPNLGLTLKSGSKAGNRFGLAGSDEGGMLAAGVGGALTGRGANLIIIDDPVKNREEADSATLRKKAWDWYTTVARTRLEPGGAIILIQTRWHEDDLGGRLVGRQEDQWHVLSLPELAESDDDLLGRSRGEPLWPERYDLADDERTRKDLGGRDWTALYQQRPAPPEGAVFRYSWIRHVEPADYDSPMSSPTLTVVGVDPASTSGDSADDTGIVVAARGSQWYEGKHVDRLWVLDDRTCHDTPAGWGKAACLAALDHGADLIAIEDNQGGEMATFVLAAAWRQLSAEGKTRGRMMPPVRRVHARVNKTLRAQPIAVWYESGTVVHVGEHVELESQMCSWVGDGDSPDRLDALVIACSQLVAPTETEKRTQIGQRWSGRSSYR